MNLDLILRGLIEIGLSIICGMLIFWAGFKFFTIMNRSIDEENEIKNNNTAVGILMAGFMFGVMLLVKSAVGPATDTLNMLMSSKGYTGPDILVAIGRIVASFVISAIFAIMILWFALQLFMVMTTEIDEMEEIKNGNISVALLIAVLIASISYILIHPLTTLLSSFVSSPILQEGMTNPIVNTDILIQALIELGITFAAGITMFFFGLKVFEILTGKIDEMAELKKDNISMSILATALIFSVMILIKAAIEPANDTLGFAIAAHKGLKYVMFAIFRIVLFFGLAGGLAFGLLFIAMRSFMFMTNKFNELEEIHKNNIGVAVIVAVLVISAALLIQDGLTLFLDGLVKAPDIGKGLMDLRNIK